MLTEATQHDLAGHLKDGDVLVCLSSSLFAMNMKSERASRRFHRSFLGAADKLPEVKFIQVDFSKMPDNTNVLGVTMWKPLPVVVLLRNGFELARKTILVGEASIPDGVGKLIEWTCRYLDEEMTTG